MEGTVEERVEGRVEGRVEEVLAYVACSAALDTHLAAIGNVACSVLSTQGGVGGVGGVGGGGGVGGIGGEEGLDPKAAQALEKLMTWWSLNPGMDLSAFAGEMLGTGVEEGMTTMLGVEEGKTTVLGVDERVVRVVKADIEGEALKTLQEAIRPVIETRILRFHRYVKWVAGVEEGTSLVGAVEGARRKVEAAGEASKGEDARAVDALWRLYEAMGSKLQTVVQMIQQRLVGSQPEDDRVMGAYLAARGQALALKLQVCKFELLAETYTPRTLPALVEIHRILVASLEEAQASFDDLSSQQAAYERLGPEMEEIASVYKSLLDEIENKEWAIQQLGS